MRGIAVISCTSVCPSVCNVRIDDDDLVLWPYLSPVYSERIEVDIERRLVEPT